MISKFFFCGGCCCFCFFFGAPCCCCLFFIELCCFFPLVPLLSQHTRHFRFYYFFGAVFRWNPDSGSGAVVVPSAAEAVNYRAEETAVVPRAG